MSRNLNEETAASHHIYLERFIAISFIKLLGGESYMLIVATICCGIRAIYKYLNFIIAVVDDLRYFNLHAAWGITVEACNILCLRIFGTSIHYYILANLALKTTLSQPLGGYLGEELRIFRLLLVCRW